MKTTVDIPEELLKEAMRNAKAATKRDAVLVALEEFNRRHRLDKARELLGTFDHLITVPQLRDARNSRGKRHGLA
jgi:Arc/MetJ family transcription regulator